MTTPTPTLQAPMAREERERTRERLEHFRRKAAERWEALEMAQANAGKRIRAAEDEDGEWQKVSGELSRIRSEAEAADGYVYEAERALREAYEAELRAHADDKRREADGLRRQADDVDNAASDLLTKLVELQGTAYAPVGWTRADNLRDQASELDGQGLVLEAAADGAYVGVGASSYDGSTIWRSACVTHEDRGVPAAGLVPRILGEDAPTPR
jgi:cysteinyl-tRNA synthetase